MRIPFTQHLGIKFMALVLGIVLWGFAYVENIEEIPLAYKVAILAPEGWTVQPEHETISVRVKGPRRLVDQMREDSDIVDKQIDAGLLDPSLDKQPVTVYVVPADLIGDRDAKLTFPNLPREVKVTATRQIRKPLPVKLRVEGKPAPGYVVSEEDCRVWPSTVEVLGPKNLLDKTAAIYTAAVDVTGMWKGFSLQMLPVEPVIDGQQVQVSVPQVGAQVEFRSKLARRVFGRVPVTFDMPNDYPYKATIIDSPTVSVTVEGPEQALATLKPEDIGVQAKVNADYYKPGQTTPTMQTLKVSAPAGFTATAAPSTVAVTVTDR